MSDLISRQDAIDAFTTVDMGGTFCYCDSIVRTLENLPSEQPEITLESAIDYLNSIDWLPEHDRIITESAKRKSAQRKGKWTLQEDKTKPHYGWHICSECGAYIGEPSNYCSECGADMRGEEDAETDKQPDSE